MLWKKCLIIAGFVSFVLFFIFIFIEEVVPKCLREFLY